MCTVCGGAAATLTGPAPSTGPHGVRLPRPADGHHLLLPPQGIRLAFEVPRARRGHRELGVTRCSARGRLDGVIGVEAAVWCETIQDEADLNMMRLLRLPVSRSRAGRRAAARRGRITPHVWGPGSAVARRQLALLRILTGRLALRSGPYSDWASSATECGPNASVQGAQRVPEHVGWHRHQRGSSPP